MAKVSKAVERYGYKASSIEPYIHDGVMHVAIDTVPDIVQSSNTSGGYPITTGGNGITWAAGSVSGSTISSTVTLAPPRPPTPREWLKAEVEKVCARTRGGLAYT